MVMWELRGHSGIQTVNGGVLPNLSDGGRNGDTVVSPDHR